MTQLGCLALLIGIALGATTARAELWAARIGEANFDSVAVGGTVAYGGIGDWALGNGTLCAVVSDPSHENEVSPRGGALIDLGHCGLDDDQLVLYAQLLNLRREGFLPVQQVEARSREGEASLITRGAHEGVAFETTYALDLREPERLLVTTRLERVDEGARVFGLADVIVQIERALRPFSLRTGDPSRSRGFVHPEMDVDSIFSITRALGAEDAHVLVGAPGLEPGIAYGLRVIDARLERPDGEVLAVPVLALATDVFAGFFSFARPFWLGSGDSAGLLQLAQTLLMDLERGAILVHEREIRVGARSDVACVTDTWLGEQPRIVGRVDDPEAKLHVNLASGAPLTQVNPGPEGAFGFRAPRGRYALRALARAGRNVDRAFEVADGGLDLGLLSVGEPAYLELPRGDPMRLVFAGLDGTPDPGFGDDLLGFRVGGARLRPAGFSRAVHLTGTAHDRARVALPPGRYRVLATRGPEFSTSEVRLELGGGETVTLEIPLPQRAVDTSGWISADLHVHAAPSDDTSLPMRAQLGSLVSQGSEVLVSTDHDQLSDYAPVIREMGLRGRIASMVGLEVTSSIPTEAAPHTTGHANVFPIPYRAREYRRGALDSENRRLRDVIASVRSLGGERIVQLNHPRARQPGYERNSLLTHLAVVGEPFDPALPLSLPPNRALVETDPETGLRDLDFDAIELLNGPYMWRYRAVREDWFSLLRQGEIRTATANSDSHGLEEIAAVPRNYVQVRDDSVQGFDAREFIRSLGEGRVFGTTGPLLYARIGEAGLGERFAGPEGTLHVEVRAAPWVPIEELRVFVNGVLFRAQPIEGDADFETTLAFERDAFVTVEVEGAADERFEALLPGVTPFAFTNPIFVDADSDGEWTPPGLE